MGGREGCYPPGEKVLFSEREICYHLGGRDVKFCEGVVLFSRKEKCNSLEGKGAYFWERSYSLFN